MSGNHKKLFYRGLQGIQSVQDLLCFEVTKGGIISVSEKGLPLKDPGEGGRLCIGNFVFFFAAKPKETFSTSIGV